jgi:hypothetical protein
MLKFCNGVRFIKIAAHLALPVEVKSICTLCEVRLSWAPFYSTGVVVYSASCTSAEVVMTSLVHVWNARADRRTTVDSDWRDAWSIMFMHTCAGGEWRPRIVQAGPLPIHRQHARTTCWGCRIVGRTGWDGADDRCLQSRALCTILEHACGREMTGGVRHAAAVRETHPALHWLPFSPPRSCHLDNFATLSVVER